VQDSDLIQLPGLGASQSVGQKKDESNAAPRISLPVLCQTPL